MQLRLRHQLPRQLRGDSTGGENSRSRADTAAAKLMPSSASAMLPTTRAPARISWRRWQTPPLRVVHGIVKARIDQHQVAVTHGFHGPRHRPDIARAAGFDQNKSQLFKKIRVDLGQVHLK
jgi:hypothetical protein